MNVFPRIRLRTLFVLFFCAAVGLTTYPSPIDALGPAIATAIVIGLVQQTRLLRAWHPAEIDVAGELAFARRLAIVWRVLVAAVMSTLIVGELLIQSGMMVLPERKELSFLPQPWQSIRMFCVIFVLCNSVARWRRSSAKSVTKRWRAVSLWVIAICVGAIMVINHAGDGRCVPAQ